ncbi:MULTISPECIES: hypothetical protein [Methylobacterium]|uniref:hypothetical protein n=1 Tax=Methylobacterium TaxID=407 RepID=UPI0011CA97FD|nr:MULTISPECIES: hypothetical protein [Methylobacterium]TXN19966.1 hypothetical protein FV217_19625 [Methylobacterium sp. WL9]
MIAALADVGALFEVVCAAFVESREPTKADRDPAVGNRLQDTALVEGMTARPEWLGRRVNSRSSS